MALVIRLNVPFDGPSHYFVISDGVVTHHTFSSYSERQENPNFTVQDYKEVVFPDWVALPESLTELVQLRADAGSRDDRFIDAFHAAWLYLEKEEAKEEDIPFKALMLFGADEDINSYDHDVFLYNSIDGVTRLSFNQYLRLVEGGHTGVYHLVKLSLARLTGLAIADFKAMLEVTGTDSSDRTYMLFRSLWYAAAGKEMPV